MHGGRLFHIAERMKRPISDFIDFSASINPLGLREAVREAIEEGIDAIIHYPSEDCRLLREILAEREGVSFDGIRIGNGAGELLFRIVRAMEGPVRALLLPPCFSEYERALRAVSGTTIRYYERDSDLEIRGDIFSHLSDINVVFLCTPENPSGLLPKRELVLELADRCLEKDIFLVADESFMDFVDEGAYSLVGKTAVNPRLIVVRSFTKRFALPGLRIGSLFASDKELLKRMDRATPAWMVNHLAQRAACRALTLPPDDEILFDLLRKERDFLKEGLEALSYQVFPGRANFLLLRDRMASPRPVFEGLLKRGKIIRPCRDFRGLGEGYYRIGIRTHEENHALVAAWKEVLAECSVL